MEFNKYIRFLFIAVIVAFALHLPKIAFSESIYEVTVITEAIKGKSGKLVFDLTNADANANTVTILDFTTDGTLGLHDTQGGLVKGDIILGEHPAPFTTIEDEKELFFNELVVNIDSLGDQITFTLQLTENRGDGEIPDEFALFLLDEKGQPMFSTDDPLGADALFIICVNGESGGGLSTFSPTLFILPSDIVLEVPE